MVENKGIFNYQSHIEGSNQNVGHGANQLLTSSQKLDLEDLTKELLDSLNGIELQQEQKQELEEVIHAATEEVSLDEPKNGILKIFLEQTKNVIDTVNKTPELISAYQKWEDFIQSSMT